MDPAGVYRTQEGDHPFIVSLPDQDFLPVYIAETGLVFTTDGRPITAESLLFSEQHPPLFVQDARDLASSTPVVASSSSLADETFTTAQPSSPPKVSPPFTLQDLEKTPPLKSEKPDNEKEDDDDSEPSDSEEEDEDDEMSDSNGGTMKPAPFMDDRNDASDFVGRTRLYFMSSPSKFSAESVKIANFLLLCQGPESKKWAGAIQRVYFKELEVPKEKRPEGWQGKYETYADVVSQFLDDWKPYDEKVRARADLDALHQGESSIEDHILKFNDLIGKADIVEEASAVYFFRKSLRPALLDDVERMNPPPETIAAYLNGARQREQRFKIRQEEKKRWGNPSAAKPTSSGGFRPKAEEKPAASSTGSVKKIGRMTDEEREELRRAGACFRCRKTGHRFFECPEHQQGGTTLAPVTPKPPTVCALLDMLKGASAEEKEKAAAELKEAGF